MAEQCESNLILLMIGTNDINADYDRPNAPGRLSNLLTKINTVKPDTKVIVAQITPIGDGWASSAATDSLAQVYNSGIADVVAQHRADGEPISLVDMHTPLNVATDLSDGLHPNQTGYDKMAQVWFDGIKSATVPEPSALSLLGSLATFGLGVRAWIRKQGTFFPTKQG